MINFKPVYDKIYIQYAEDIITGKIASCEAIKLACKRFLDWFSREDIYFDYDTVEKMIRFIGKMKHSTGNHSGLPFILLPWQLFCIANIFGWKYQETGLRVTSNVFIMISRKSGKTAFASAIALCCLLADGEGGAEVELVANNRQLAHIAFDACRNFSETLDPKGSLIKATRDKLNVPLTKSFILVLSSEAMGNDGYNSSCFILDEFHASKTWDLYNVMKSSQGMRSLPLGIVITTAGFLLSPYPCYSYRLTCIDILKGLKHDDTTFSAIYELDEDDDWQDENNWIKCAPSLGLTVTYKYLRDQVLSAINLPATEVGVKTKNFNMFCQSATVWINDLFITKNSHQVDLKDFKGDLCYMGVDLSAVSDLTCTALVFPPNSSRKKWPDKFVCKVIPYLPASALQESVNKEIYKEWYRHKHINITEGNVVDYDEILKDLIVLNNNFDIVNIAYDSWNATQWAINATNAGLNLQPYSQALGNFNRPTKNIEMLIKKGDIILDDNPVLRWCFGNIELKVDWNENAKPVKAGGDNNKKIDCVIAILQALGSYLLEGDVE